MSRSKRERPITTSDYDREEASGRLANGGGVAQVNVSAATESEMKKEKKARVEDTSCCAAVEEILPGGGVAFTGAPGAGFVKLPGDEAVGVDIVREKGIKRRL